MNGGSSRMADDSAVRSRAMAPVVVARPSTSEARSSRRSATSVTSLEEATTKRLSNSSSRCSSANRRVDATSEGFR
jgi:hypothetical protein